MSSTATPSSTPPPSSAATSSFLPLTTVFPVPTSCFDNIYYALFTSPDISAFRDYNALSSQCYPESYGAFEYPTATFEASWYSPGVCPSGYAIASSYYDNEASATRAYCCPGASDKEWVPDFPWGGDGGRRVCISTVTTSTSLVLADRTTVVTDFFSAYDWPISVMWAESDLNKFTPASAPLLAGKAASTSNAASTSSPAQMSETGTSTALPTPTGSKGLSTGAEVGIGIGVAAIALALLAVAGFILYRRRKAKKVQPEGHEWAQPAPTSEIGYGKDMGHHQSLSEMDSSSGVWSPQQTYRSELEGEGSPGYKPHRSEM